MGVEIFTAIIA